MQENSRAEFGADDLWRGLLILFGFVLLGMSLGNILMIFIFQVLSPGGEGDLSKLLANPQASDYGWYAIMVLQGFVHICTFFIPSLLYGVFVERYPVRAWFSHGNVPVSDVLSVFALTMVSIPFVSLTIEWNQGLVFPEFLKDVEVWMRNKEDELAGLTKKYMDFDSWEQLAVALLVVAVIPAIGEEFLFRGVIQRKLTYVMKHPHAAVWISAAVFSAIHFQFYGFIPRLLLGALFGYIYLWTGRLSLAVLSHLVNNGLMVLMVYLYRRKITDINIEDNHSISPMLAAASLLLVVLMMRWLYQKYHVNQPAKS